MQGSSVVAGKPSSTTAQGTESGTLHTKQLGSLPPELLVHVFIFTLPDYTSRLCIPPHRLPPLTLSQVCRSWRTLVLNSPQLWCNIVTDIHGTNSAQAMRMFELWASRAGDMPLSIQHMPQIFDGLHILLANMTSGLYEDHTTAFVRAILSRAKQLKKLGLNVLDSDVLAPVSYFINVDRPSVEGDSRVAGGDGTESIASFPLLEELELASTHLGTLSDEHVLESIDLACPQLRTLTLRFPSTVPGLHVAPMQSMRNLNLKFVTAVSHCLRWMSVCPNLDSLSVGLFCRDDSLAEAVEDWVEQLNAVDDMDLDEDDWVVIPQPRRRPRNQSLVTQHHMRSLTQLAIWICGTPRDLDFFLKSLDAPALRNFAVATSLVRQPDELHPSILDFIRRCRPRLDEFECTGSLMQLEDVCASLDLLPDLRVLKLSKSNELDQILYHLVASALGNVVCPKLEEINLAESRFSLQLVEALVYSRSGIMIGSGDDDDPQLCLPIKRLVMDPQYVQMAKERPVLLECVSRGMVIEAAD